MNVRKILVLLLHAFIGWALCAATMGIGMSLTSQQTILIIHAIAAPIFFCIISVFYFKKFNYTKPLITAITFTAFVIVVDLLVVGLIIIKSLDMFKSLLGTWIPPRPPEIAPSSAQP